MNRTVIRNAIVLSMDPAIGEHLDGDVLIDGPKIAAVRPNLGPVDAHEIDGRGMIVMPGFVDTHRHTWQCLLRNAAADWSLAQYFGGVRGVMGELYTADDMYVANHIGSLEALDAGITTLVDWSHNNNTPEHADACVKGLQDSGIRAVYAYGNANREWFPVSDKPTNFDDVARVRKALFQFGRRARDNGVRCPRPAIRHARHDGARLQGSSQARPADHAPRRRRPLGPRSPDRPAQLARACSAREPLMSIAARCSDHEFKLMADTGGSASLSAEVELNMGHGNPATLGCLKHGLRPSISIDICTSVGGDMFTQIRILMAATRGIVNAEALKEKKLLDPLPLTARDMLDFATLQGAKTAGLDRKTGSLTPGKDADLILINTDSLNMFPVNNPVGAVIEDAHIGNIDSVFVRGRAVKRHGKLVDVDVRALRRRMEATVDGLFARAKVKRDGNWLPKPYVGGTDVEKQRA